MNRNLDGPAVPYTKSNTPIRCYLRSSEVMAVCNLEGGRISKQATMVTCPKSLPMGLTYNTNRFMIVASKGDKRMEKWIVRRTIRLTQEVEAETKAEALEAFCETDARIETIKETAHRGCFIDITDGRVYHKTPHIEYTEVDC